MEKVREAEWADGARGLVAGGVGGSRMRCQLWMMVPSVPGVPVGGPLVWRSVGTETKAVVRAMAVVIVSDLVACYSISNSARMVIFREH